MAAALVWFLEGDPLLAVEADVVVETVVLRVLRLGPPLGLEASTEGRRAVPLWLLDELLLGWEGAVWLFRTFC